MNEQSRKLERIGLNGAERDNPDQQAPSRPDGFRHGVSRRGLLIGTGLAGVAVGAGGLEAIRRVSDDSSKAGDSGVIPPSEDLMRDHGVLKRVLLIYREASGRVARGADVPLHALRESAGIIHEFIEGFHEGLEEAYVFPRLQHAGMLVDTVTTLLVQHARGRRLTQQILSDATPQGLDTPAGRQRIATALNQFVRMYEPHEAWEDTVIFPAFRELLPAAEFAALGAQFADLETARFGPQGFSDLVQRTAQIESAFGLADLTQFTPPP